MAEVSRDYVAVEVGTLTVFVWWMACLCVWNGVAGSRDRLGTISLVESDAEVRPLRGIIGSPIWALT